MKHLQLRVVSIVNVSLILIGLKQVDKVIFPLLLSFLFLLFSIQYFHKQQRKFNNSILQLKDLIDQAQKLLYSSQINVNVVLNPVPTVFDLYVDNYLQNHNSQNYSWKKGKPELSVIQFCQASDSTKCQNKKP